MRTAAAGTNPSMIGCEIRYATAPAFRSPTASRAMPTITASSIPSRTYSPLPGVARVERAPKARRLVSAVGPVCRYGDDANSAATMGGRAAA
jgi:hypothetical protein